ncbi:DNA-3-methyladenine glycosylase [Sphaerisporangium corydalis]|uniref:Putative 3-methyladenine DNA glycosylase n=1 Tax=Sphaerisporangium corydalis TaxID=1441875 RepID=A0ABV9E9I3_9ACTN|nr:DNA-3-methyladenine glycosylase [Sphaerisporangium corydalis]
MGDRILDREFFDRPAHEVAPDLLGRVLRHGPVAVRLTEVEAYGPPGEDPASHTYRGRTPRNSVMFGPPGHLYVYFTYGMHYCANLVCLPEGMGSGVLLRAGEIIEGADLARTRRHRPSTSPALTGRDRTPPTRDLARGPARLAVALALTRAHNGLDCCTPPPTERPARPDLSGHLERSGRPDSSAYAERNSDAEPSGHAGSRPSTSPVPGAESGADLSRESDAGWSSAELQVLVGEPADPALIRSGPRTGVSTGATTPWRFWIDGDPTVSPYRKHVPKTRPA